MKKLILTVAMVLAFVSTSMAGERVRGYWKDTNKDGVKDTYIDPYYRSERNNSVWDNYSTKGNINPYTGREGTVDPYKSIYNNPYNYNNPYGR